MALTGQTVNQIIAAISRNTATAHTAVDQQDVARLKNRLEAIRAVKEIVYQEAMKATDAAYDVLFNKPADVYRSEYDCKHSSARINQHLRSILCNLTGPGIQADMLSFHHDLIATRQRMTTPKPDPVLLWSAR